MATSITLKDIKCVKMLRAASTMKNKRKDLFHYFQHGTSLVPLCKNVIKNTTIREHLSPIAKEQKILKIIQMQT